MNRLIPFPEFETRRLILRMPALNDWPEILFLRSDSVVNKYIQRPIERQTNTKDDALKFIERMQHQGQLNTSFYWSICLKNNPKTIGTICLWNFTKDSSSAELGYDLNPDFHGKGIMSEALDLIVNFGFNELNKNSIEAFTHQNNRSSINMLERKGFQLNLSRKDEHNALNRIFERFMTAESLG